MRHTLLMLINKMQQPSLPELMEFARELSYFHGEYREIASRRYASLYYYLDSLVVNKKIMRLTADTGYTRRYCIYHDDRRFDQFVEPIPFVSFQENDVVNLTICSKEVPIDTENKNLKTNFWDGRKLQIFSLRNRFFVILDHVLLGVLRHSGSRWYVRLPWRIFDKGTEYTMAFTGLISLGEKIDVLGVKGKRAVCGRGR